MNPGKDTDAKPASVHHASSEPPLDADTQPTDSNSAATVPVTDQPDYSGTPLGEQLQIAAGRQLPDLLFVTSRAALAANIGYAESTYLLDTLRESGALLYDVLPQGLPSSTAAMDLVRPQLQQHDHIEGVVLIGGYDVVPTQRLDTLDPTLRNVLRDAPQDITDSYYVWSDDVYGDRDGDEYGLPELPVSRIPDGRSSHLVFASLQANDRSQGEERDGVRNIERPFADAIYNTLQGTGPMRTSEPTISSIQNPGYSLTAEKVYLQLHGNYTDGSRFWGEYRDPNANGQPEALNVGNIPSRCDSTVVFCGCCWGALIVDKPARLADGPEPLGPKTSEASIALSFLARGARAFIGCTGAHYSPFKANPAANPVSQPLHAAFWRNYSSGDAPAQALFRAKIEYIRGMPHRIKPTYVSQAIENKTFRQFTCLGLGW